MKRRLWLLLVLTIFIFVSFFLGIGILFFGAEYTTAFAIWSNLRNIPGVKVVAIHPFDEKSSLVTISVEKKGIMTFGSLRLDQFSDRSIYPIGLSEIAGCKVEVVSETSYRDWLVLTEEETGVDARTVQKAISNYDKIFREVKSWPSIPSGLERKPGRYANCS